MWYVYLLLCDDQSLYTGCTNDLEKRFLTHLKGKGGHYTRAHRPLKVVYQESWPDRSTALKREAEIKSWKRQEKLAKLDLSV